MSMFAGAARYYRQYRPGIPAEAVRLLRSEAGRLAPARRLLDLGTGTGQVPAALHGHLREIDAVEPDAHMVAQADMTLRPLLAEDATLRLHNQRAESFGPPYPGWRADLVTICRAFHWMDQPTLLTALDSYVADTGVVAVMGDGSLWTARSPWTDALRELIQRHLGKQRRAGDQTFAHHNRPYAEVLADSTFSRVREVLIPLQRVWTPEEVIGYLYSTSFAARHLFGERIEEFEAAATDLLEEFARGGPLLEHVEFQVLLARRGPSASTPPASPRNA
ncbi:class I SAM-dependent methyltransferase [Microtetraspora malaysiensis]|uniref:class I SAM-dependent methyltransferase n=1 Tax=Microtetraspora malaysiensis TaxID=161358 RepID=UPI003D90CAD7